MGGFILLHQNPDDHGTLVPYRLVPRPNIDSRTPITLTGVEIGACYYNGKEPVLVLYSDTYPQVLEYCGEVQPDGSTQLSAISLYSRFHLCLSFNKKYEKPKGQYLALREIEPKVRPQTMIPEYLLDDVLNVIGGLKNGKLK